ncbi:MAG TPA: hypothetical protein VKU82_03135 [Planctomycetaceae bacterium]|nr:hypothetical protein [Planctomycetaceae bacterium]
MEPKYYSNVADLSDEQRLLLESLIGRELRRDQVLCWLIVSPDRHLTAADKARSRAGLQTIFDKVDRHVADEEISPDEFTLAVDEAVRQVRSQRVE